MQFPSISLRFTESKILLRLNKSLSVFFGKKKVKKIILITSSIVVSLIILVLSLGIFVAGYKIYQNLMTINNLNTQRDKLKSEINFWTSVASKYPGYKDAYFKIAALEYSLGNLKIAQEFNNRALLLDPNYQDAIKLKIILLKK